MSNLNAPIAGGTVRGTSAADVITGSANADVLWGLGGADVINGGDGNDVIEGDGVYSASTAFRTSGFYLVPYTATSSLSGKPTLTARGLLPTGEEVWSIRNTTDVAQVVRFESSSNGAGGFGPFYYTVPAHSDFFITSPAGTAKIYYAANGTTFTQADVQNPSRTAYESPVAELVAPDGNDFLSGGNGDDTLRGWGGNDTLNGDAGKDSLDGGTGNDKLVGGAGADKLIGGDGIDTADYSASSGGITVNLELGTGKGGDAEGDTLAGVENLVGSKFDDVLTGDGSSNVIDGGDGNDIITGGGNNDQLFGGAGDDLFLVERSNSGDHYDGGTGVDTFSADVPGLSGYVQEIDLATGKNNRQDTFVSIENLIGGTNNDKFWGTDGENSFWGRGGNDLLDGRGGNDKIYGEVGNDTLIGGAGNDLLVGGEGNDLLVGGTGADVLDGGNGVDTTEYVSSDAGVNVNLSTGIGAGGDAEGDTISGVENVIGSKFNDILTGNAAANIISGGAGNDILVGSAGSDTMIGGDGIDTLDYSALASCVTVNLGAGTATSHNKADKLESLENVIGTKYNDTITGDAGANIVSAGDGKDRFVGSGGGDSFDGGAGRDWIDYRNSKEAVYVNLLEGAGKGGLAQGDSYKNIENIRGTAGDDTLIGDNEANVFYAGKGSDRIEGGGGNDMIYTSGGYDYVDGGAGVDTLSYAESWDRVVVNLTSGNGQYGAASRDTITNVENLVGSKFNDVLTGDAGVNNLNGASGNDILRGAGGNDVLVGGAGADIIDGGEGVDTVSYSGTHTGVTLSLATGGGKNADASQNGVQPLSPAADDCPEDELSDVANAVTANSSYAAIDGVTDATGDTFVGVENVLGSAWNDNISGDGLVNRLAGGAGNDILNGAGGNDYLLGGIGSDTLIGGVGADVFVFDVGFGNDTISDFWFGAGRTDRVQLRGSDMLSFNDVLSHATDSSAGVMLSVNGGHDSITFTGITVSQLVADDFLFA